MADMPRKNLTHQQIEKRKSKIVKKLADYDPVKHGPRPTAPQALGILATLDAVDNETTLHDFLIEMEKHVRSDRQSMRRILRHYLRRQPFQKLISVTGLGGNVPVSNEKPAPSADLSGDVDISYSAANIIKEGCFLPHDDIEQLLERLKVKKNLILQGPPGTGKTWLAKRLAYALMGEKNPRNVRAVQFHPNLSYEDFVRGWRPSGDGKLKLTDGVFMQTVNTALDNPESKFAVVIEEINRGNPAQIFGELLTLLEADKRNPADALELSYPGPDGENEPVYIPENLYVIGTMNLADRSLALVDFALRRRFAFVTLEPKFTDEWKKWIIERRNVNDVLAEQIQVRIKNLNQNIADDKKLGPQFCIGHSYLTPAESIEDHGTDTWFRQVVETEIFPLLEEYWFDDPDKAGQERDKLLADWD